MEDIMIKLTRKEVISALEDYVNNHMRSPSHMKVRVKRLEVTRNRSTKYLLHFEVGE